MSNSLTRRGILLSLGGVGVSACSPESRAVLEEIIHTSRDVAAGRTGGVHFSQTEATQAIKQALLKGTDFAVRKVGARNGYLQDGHIRIPLPGSLKELQGSLSRVGLSGMLDNLQVQINRGAERAALLAKGLFFDAVKELSVADAVAIVRGPENSATQYLQERTGADLVRLFTPIMSEALEKVGAMQTLEQIVTNAKHLALVLPLAHTAKQDLIDHGVARGIDGIFFYIAQEEAAIRATPVKRTSDILRKVFG